MAELELSVLVVVDLDRTFPKCEVQLLHRLLLDLLPFAGLGTSNPQIIQVAKFQDLLDRLRSEQRSIDPEITQ